MSDSDGADDDDGYKAMRKAKKTAVAMEIPVITVEEETPDDVPDPFERLEIRERPAARQSEKIPEKRDSRIRAGWLVLFCRRCIND